MTATRTQLLAAMAAQIAGSTLANSEHSLYSACDAAGVTERSLEVAERILAEAEKRAAPMAGERIIRIDIDQVDSVAMRIAWSVAHGTGQETWTASELRGRIHDVVAKELLDAVESVK